MQLEGCVSCSYMVVSRAAVTCCHLLFAAENGGINYLAILDTAADVAKAMLHLHSLNVLHSDL